MSKDKNSIGPLIAEARKALGMTQVELAKASGYTQSSISRTESGKCGTTFETLNALSDAMGAEVNVSISYSTASGESQSVIID